MMKAYKLTYNHELFILEYAITDKTIDDIVFCLNMRRFIEAYKPTVVTVLLAETVPMTKLAKEWFNEVTTKDLAYKKENTRRYRISEIYHEPFEERIFNFVRQSDD